ncbi:MAG TPA: GDSL-type esterase/lipase family protein, partial [Myxococcota bacterium]
MNSAASTSSSTGSARTTLATLGVFLSLCTFLAMAPLPSWAKPLELRSMNDAQKVAERVFKKPKMTLQHVEEKLAAGGSADGRDAPAGQSIDDEEKELLKTRDAKADVDALQGVATPVEEPEAPVIHVDRADVVAKVRSPKADAFAAEQKTVQAPGAAIENPCLIEEPSPQGGVRCTRTALDAYYATLDAIAAGDESARAEAVVLGNSLIASDHVVDVVRARLVERFGDAGRGFLLPERLSKVAGRKVRTGEGTNGWSIQTFAQDPPTDGSKLGPFGLTGSLHESSVNGERTTWTTEGAKSAKLFYLEHAGQPGMRLEARGSFGTQVIAKVEAIAKSVVSAQKDETVDVDLPAATNELVLVAEGKGAKVYGVSLERDHAGVIVDTIGVPAASARLYVEGADADIFERQVALREPSLYVLMLGGNEVRGINYGTIDAKKFDGYLTELVHRLKTAAPNASCLLVAPIDAVKASAAGEELQTRPEIYEVMKVQRAVAKREGCAYFDLFTAMGGAGALARFKDKGMLSDDLVHPTWKGGDVLGQIFADAVLASYVKTPPPDDGVAVARRKTARVRAPVFAGLSFPAEERAVIVVKGEHTDNAQPKRRALQRFFEKLRALEKGDTAALVNNHVTIGQLGASHTAGQMWTDRMRERLGEKFGVAGRGLVAVGRESKRLEASGVERQLEGAFEIADGREVVLGGAVGMSGTKVRLEPGAHFAASFCTPEIPRAKVGERPSTTKVDPYGCTKSPGTLTLSWLYTPDMGTADVAVDGKTVAVLSQDQRSADSDVQFLKLPIDGDTATIDVTVRGGDGRDRRHHSSGGDEGPVHLLSVVEERDRPGIVLDSVGLPGTTGMTPQRWRQDLLA